MVVTLRGLDRQLAAFGDALHGLRLHHAWLLAGPRGIGKAHFADWAMRALLNASDVGSTGAKLLAAGSHPDFIRIERLTDDKTGKRARSIKVEQVRSLRTVLATSTSQGQRRVVIIDSVDDLEGHSGPNALLKMLEEPPASTIFLLVSHQPGRLLPTIRSRCRTLPFLPYDATTMRLILSDALPSLEAADRDILIANANGSPGAALAFANLDMTAIDDALEALSSRGHAAGNSRDMLVQSLSLKAAAPRYEAFLNRAPTFIAAQARKSTGPALDRALVAWSKARALAQVALAQSLIAETVVFEMAGYVAALAPVDRRVKA